MNIYSAGRLVFYALTFLATSLALAGYAAFDGSIVDIGPIFGLDLPPFNVAELAGWITSGLASMAVMFGWGQKK